MDRKKLLIPILTGALAVILLAVFLLPGRVTPPGADPVGSKPAAQSQSAQTRPPQTETPETETTAPAGTEQTVPEATEPEADAPEQTEPAQTEPEQTEPPAQLRDLFPAELEGGMLTVQSLFPFTGMNPDAANEFGEDIAGIELTNTSDRHMTAAEVTVILDNGDILTFLAEDIPAGRTAMALCLEQSSVSDERSCMEIYGYAEFGSGDVLLSDLVECTVDGIAITVRNLSNETLTDLDVYCHGLLDSSYFGGTTYCYHVSTLPAGGSTVIYAEDCFLGMAEVVRVERGS